MGLSRGVKASMGTAGPAAALNSVSGQKLRVPLQSGRLNPVFPLPATQVSHCCRPAQAFCPSLPAGAGTVMTGGPLSGQIRAAGLSPVQIRAAGLSPVQI